MDDLLKLKDDAPNRVHWPAVNLNIGKDEPFLFVEDEARRETIMSKGDFRLIEGDLIERALGDGAVSAIEAGDYDDILDSLYYAESEHERRGGVLDAIARRSTTLEAKRDTDGRAISATDITTV